MLAACNPVDVRMTRVVALAVRIFTDSDKRLPGAGSPLYLDLLAGRLSDMPLHQALSALTSQDYHPNTELPPCLTGRDGMCQPVLQRLELAHGPLGVQAGALSLSRHGGCTEQEVYERVARLFSDRCLQVPSAGVISDILRHLRPFTSARTTPLVSRLVPYSFLHPLAPAASQPGLCPTQPPGGSRVLAAPAAFFALFAPACSGLSCIVAALRRRRTPLSQAPETWRLRHPPSWPWP